MVETLKGINTSLLDDVDKELRTITSTDVPKVSFSSVTASPEQQPINTQLQTIINSISDNPDYNDTPQEPRISELLKKGDYVKAITRIFDFIGVVFGKGMAPSSHISFEKTASQINFEAMNIETLTATITTLQNDIKSASSITRSLHFTSLLSRAKDNLIKKEQPNIENDSYNLLKNNLQAGDILLINKRKDTSFGAQALRGFDMHNPADYTHSMLVSRIDEDGTVWVTQSTQHKESGPGSGVEEIPLKNYLNKHKPADVLALNQTDPYKTQSLNYAQEQIGKGYDNKVALLHAFSGVIPNSMESKVTNNDEFNCVELIAQSYQNNSKVKHFSHPNEFLGHNGIFTPSYMTEIV